MPRLADVATEFRAEAQGLVARFADCARHAPIPGFRFAYRPTTEGCVVGLWDAWGRFLRELVFTSCSGPCVGRSGTSYVPQVARTADDALGLLVANKRGNHFQIINGEPKWQSTIALSDIGIALGIQNHQTISDAVGATHVRVGSVTSENPTELIRLTRNFIAHKHAGTLSELESALSSPVTSIHGLLSSKVAGVELFEFWVQCLVSLAEAATD